MPFVPQLPRAAGFCFHSQMIQSTFFGSPPKSSSRLNASGRTRVVGAHALVVAPEVLQGLAPAPLVLLGEATADGEQGQEQGAGKQNETPHGPISGASGCSE